MPAAAPNPYFKPVIVSQGYSDLILSQGPIAYYKMDETSGTLLEDSSGNGNDASIDVITPVTGLVSDGGTAIQFANTNEAFTGLIMPTGDFTLEVWHAPATKNTGDVILSAWNGSSNLVVLLWDATGVIQMSFRNSVPAQFNLDSTTDQTIGQAYLNTVTYSDANGWRFYVNGIEEISQATDRLILASQSIHLNQYGNSANKSAGDYDSWVIFDKELTAAEVLQHYNVGKV